MGPDRTSPSAFRSFRYRHTACYVARAADGRLVALDCGWPATFLEYARQLKDTGARLQDIAWACATHMHPDHVGLLGELQEHGVECVVFDRQADAIPAMERIATKSTPGYRPIHLARLTQLATAHAAEWFAARGLALDAVPTPGHSDDSVSFISASGEAVVGDLTLPELTMPDDAVTWTSWGRLYERGVRHVLPAHPPPFELTAAHLRRGVGA